MDTSLPPPQLLEADNRKISYRRIGSGARKIIFFHGFPGSSVQIEFFRPFLETFDLDVICVDRPGYGETLARGPNQFEDVTHTVEAVVASVAWTSYELVSVSGGTPFVFAFLRNAHEVAEAIRRVSIISGLGPVASSGFETFVNWRSKCATQILARVPGRFIKRGVPLEGRWRFATLGLVGMMLPASGRDRAVFRDPRVSKILLQSLHEAFQQGGEGPKRDAWSFFSKWGFDIGAYRGAIEIWHGSEDVILLPAMAKRMATLVPRARLRILEGEGHYSPSIARLGDILGA
jgi:pimeloyl-ACP methyl ester carboxylesterase